MFKMAGHVGHLGFATGMILAILDLQFTLILPTKLCFNWPFGSGKKVQNRFSKNSKYHTKQCHLLAFFILSLFAILFSIFV